MNMIKKIIKISTLSLAILGFLPLTVNAATILNPIGEDTIAGIITRVSGFIQPILVMTLLVLIFVAGFTRLTSAGDSEKEQKSVKILTSAVIGFMIVVLAPLIIRMVSAILGIKVIIP